MASNIHFNRLENNQVRRAVPELFFCPECGSEVEIWTDESRGRCSTCKNSFFREKAQKITDESVVTPPDHSSGAQSARGDYRECAPPRIDDHRKIRAALKQLTRLACSLGATDAAVISTNDIRVEDDLARLCESPRCENYGLSASCPPRVSGPSGFREVLKAFQQAVVLKIDVPSKILLSSERRDIFILLHEIVAAVEEEAVKTGFSNARAYAGGSCKMLFCRSHAYCRVLAEGGECRNPRSARPSMSGFGINVSQLMRTAGWTLQKVDPQADSNQDSMGTVSGLILVL